MSHFSQIQTFTLLITLNVSSSVNRSTALRAIESSLVYALGNLTTAMAQVQAVEIQRYGTNNTIIFDLAIGLIIMYGCRWM